MAGVIFVSLFAYFIHFIIEIPFVTAKKKNKLPDVLVHSHNH